MLLKRVTKKKISAIFLFAFFVSCTHQETNKQSIGVADRIEKSEMKDSCSFLYEEFDDVFLKYLVNEKDDISISKQSQILDIKSNSVKLENFLHSYCESTNHKQDAQKWCQNYILITSLFQMDEILFNDVFQDIEETSMILGSFYTHQSQSWVSLSSTQTIQYTFDLVSYVTELSDNERYLFFEEVFEKASRYSLEE